jgi:toxin ParE1/3/4
MSRIARTPQARKDLKRHAEQLAKDASSLDVGDRWLLLLREKAILYAAHPEAGDSCPELPGNLRRFFVWSYVVYYKPLRDGIEIVRVLHGAQDLPTAWKPEP